MAYESDIADINYRHPARIIVTTYNFVCQLSALIDVIELLSPLEGSKIPPKITQVDRHIGYNPVKKKSRKHATLSIYDFFLVARYGWQTFKRHSRGKGAL